jgi:hypothetical protein
MVSSGVVAPTELEGCTAAEIRRVERKYGIRLPATYRRFLEVMGRNSGRLFTHDWVEAGYPDILKARAQLQETLAETGAKFELPSDALVILARDGEQFNYIRCDRPDDSAVWAIDLGALRVRPRHFRTSVLGWLRAWAREAAEAVASGWDERKHVRGNQLRKSPRPTPERTDRA